LGSLVAFALTALIIEITPGPNMTYLAALSLSNGVRVGFSAVAGITLGLMTYGVIAALGLAALMTVLHCSYGLPRWGGVAYLLWLGWESWASGAKRRRTRSKAMAAGRGLPSGAG
jgi:threonine/homoserine/homoserine lactone efflux protein